MIEIEGLDHVVIRTRHPGRLVSFYRDVLGCAVERETAPAIGLVQLRAGDSLIDIVSVDGEIGRQGGRGPGREGRNLDHFCLRVVDFDEAVIREHLMRFGVSTGDTQNRYGARGLGPSIYIVDPDGNTIELKGPPPHEA